jgi:hypothetical protein
VSPSGVQTEARVEHERGRWAVYLDVFMVDDDGRPSGVQVRRIDDYPTRRQAEVAAAWMLRAARRRPRWD